MLAGASAISRDFILSANRIISWIYLTSGGERDLAVGECRCVGLPGLVLLPPSPTAPSPVSRRSRGRGRGRGRGSGRKSEW